MTPEVLEGVDATKEGPLALAEPVVERDVGRVALVERRRADEGREGVSRACTPDDVRHRIRVRAGALRVLKRVVRRQREVVGPAEVERQLGPPAWW